MEFNPYIYKARVVKVYDGDTITVDIDLGFGISFGQQIRLYGIDTPELRLEEREAGLKARDYLRSLILNKEITLVTHKDRTGKYGRYLATVYLGEENICKKLLDEGYAEEYK